MHHMSKTKPRRETVGFVGSVAWSYLDSTISVFGSQCITSSCASLKCIRQNCQNRITSAHSMLLNGIKRGHEGCVRDRDVFPGAHRGRFMNGGWETLAQEMRNSITSDTGDLRPPSIHPSPPHTHSIFYSSRGVGGLSFGGRGEFRRVVGFGGWVLGLKEEER